MELRVIMFVIWWLEHPLGRLGGSIRDRVRPKYFKVGIHSFPAWLSDSVKIKLTSSLVVTLGKALNGVVSTFEWLNW